MDLNMRAIQIAVKNTDCKHLYQKLEGPLRALLQPCLGPQGTQRAQFFGNLTVSSGWGRWGLRFAEASRRPGDREGCVGSQKCHSGCRSLGDVLVRRSWRKVLRFAELCGRGSCFAEVE
ncbi:unnamed protein product [Effrenium voratum]|nr:unnamed protein product [Effrenium voratum]